LAIFIRHLVQARAYPCMYTYFMPDCLKYAEPYWLRVLIEHYEVLGDRSRKIIYIIEDRHVSFQQWLICVPIFLGKLLIYYIMLLPWLFITAIICIFMLVFGSVLFQMKFMAISKVHNTFFKHFTGRISWNIKDPLHLTSLNESLFYSVISYSLPQFVIQAANAKLSNSTTVLERTAISFSALMILWVSIRTFIHTVKNKKIEDIPINLTFMGLNFLNVDRSLILPPEPASGELPVDAELDEVDSTFQDDDQDIICVELGEAIADSGQMTEVSRVGQSKAGTDYNLLAAPFDFLDFWSVFGGEAESLPTAKPIKTSNAIKAIGVHVYNGQSNNR